MSPLYVSCREKMAVQCKQKGADLAARVCSRISAFLVTFLKAWFPNLQHAKFQYSS